VAQRELTDKRTAKLKVSRNRIGALTWDCLRVSGDGQETEALKAMYDGCCFSNLPPSLVSPRIGRYPVSHHLAMNSKALGYFYVTFYPEHRVVRAFWNLEFARES